MTSSEMMNGVVGVLGSAQQWQRAMMILNQMVESKVLLLGCGGGGVKSYWVVVSNIFLFSSLFGEMIQFD